MAPPHRILPSSTAPAIGSPSAASAAGQRVRAAARDAIDSAIEGAWPQWPEDVPAPGGAARMGAPSTRAPASKPASSAPAIGPVPPSTVRRAAGYASAIPAPMPDDETVALLRAALAREQAKHAAAPPLSPQAARPRHDRTAARPAHLRLPPGWDDIALPSLPEPAARTTIPTSGEPAPKPAPDEIELGETAAAIVDAARERAESIQFEIADASAAIAAPAASAVSAADAGDGRIEPATAGDITAGDIDESAFAAVAAALGEMDLGEMDLGETDLAGLDEDAPDEAVETVPAAPSSVGDATAARHSPFLEGGADTGEDAYATACIGADAAKAEDEGTRGLVDSGDDAAEVHGRVQDAGTADTGASVDAGGDGNLGAMLEALDEIGRRVRALAEGPPVAANTTAVPAEPVADEALARPEPAPEPVVPQPDLAAIERRFVALSAKIDRAWRHAEDDLRTVRSDLGVVVGDIGEIRQTLAGLAAKGETRDVETRDLEPLTARIDSLAARHEAERETAEKSRIEISAAQERLVDELATLADALADADFGAQFERLHREQRVLNRRLDALPVQADLARLDGRIADVATALHAVADVALQPQDENAAVLALADKVDGLSQRMDVVTSSVAALHARPIEVEIDRAFERNRERIAAALGDQISAQVALDVSVQVSTVLAEQFEGLIALVEARLSAPASPLHPTADTGSVREPAMRTAAIAPAFAAASEPAYRPATTDAAARWPETPAPAPAATHPAEHEAYRPPHGDASATPRSGRSLDAILRARAAVNRVVSSDPEADAAAAPMPVFGGEMAASSPSPAALHVRPPAAGPTRPAPVAPVSEPTGLRAESVAPAALASPVPPSTVAFEADRAAGARPRAAAGRDPDADSLRHGLSDLIAAARAGIAGRDGDDSPRPASRRFGRARVLAVAAVSLVALALLGREGAAGIAALFGRDAPAQSTAATDEADDAAIRALAAQMVANSGRAAPAEPLRTETAAPAPAAVAAPAERSAAAPAVAAPFSLTPADSTGADGAGGLPESIGPRSLRDAALSGDRFAAYDIAMRFLEGSGVAPDPAAAADWFRRSALAGDARAAFRLASMIEHGTGVAKDPAAARGFYLQAANGGNVLAMHNLAVLLSDGSGGTPDAEGAARWFRAAAGHGVVDSQFNLGVLYLRGSGVPVDYAEAYRWFSLAAAGGDEQAKSRRDATAQRIDAGTRSRVDAEVASWTPEPADPFANAAESTSAPATAPTPAT
ncbi:tetratricopeptide repeat protein [Pseudoxanthobacter soli]|nr:tetratricopeptide repeat protein [Pseudoxanthobacter soli]